VSAREYSANGEIHQISNRYDMYYGKVRILEPKKGEIVYGDTVKITGTYLPNVAVVLYLNGTTVRVLCDENGIFTYTFPTNLIGINTLSIQVGSNTFKHHFSVPYVQITSPENGTVFDTDSITVTGKNYFGKKTQIDIESLSQTTHSKKITHTTSSFSETFNNLPEGKYTLTAYSLTGSNDSKRDSSQKIEFTIQKPTPPTGGS